MLGTQPWREDLVRRGDVSEIVHDREGKVLRFFQEHDCGFTEEFWSGVKAALCYAHNFVWQLPEVDAVKVVRCRDCKRYIPQENTIPPRASRCFLYGYAMPPDGYCHEGKPKESE